VAIDPAQQTVLARTLLPYPGGAGELVGLEGIQFGQNGSVFIAHNGYFHYGDPGNPEAPLQWPRTNIVTEYMLPDLGGADFDMFALADVTPSNADCLLQFGSALDAVKALPAAGLFPNGAHPSWQLRVNNSGPGDEARVSHTYAGPCLIYAERRGGNVTFYINGVEAGTDTLNDNGDDAWGPVHAPELGGANTNDNRHTAMAFYAAGAALGAGANRQVIEGALAHRHGQEALLPVGHPFKSAAPEVGDITTPASAPSALVGDPIRFNAALAGTPTAPTLNITDVVLGGTTGPYTFFIATHGDGTLTKQEVIDGAAAAILDALSFQDADGAVTGQALTLTTPVTDGRMSIVLSDSLGATSGVVMLGDVTFEEPSVTWQAPTVESTSDGAVTLSAGANPASAPSAPTIDATGDGQVTLNAA
jgi:hypothetical protein